MQLYSKYPYFFAKKIVLRRNSNCELTFCLIILFLGVFFQFELWLQERSQSYSNMIQLKSIGKSREGKDIWQVKVCGFCFLICSTCTYGSILITKKKYSVLSKFWLIFHHRLLPTWTMPRSRPCTWSVWPTPENGSRGRCVSAPSTSWVSGRTKKVC